MEALFLRTKVSTSLRDSWGPGSLSPEKVFKLRSLERQKIPFCDLRKCAFIFHLYSGIEYMIPRSNLFCTKMEETKL